jgi:hypothetical protein|tara:strand:- start:5270 stop:5467 length:198 start_codon:yes stop_codon:yes gene_type:complete
MIYRKRDTWYVVEDGKDTVGFKSEEEAKAHATPTFKEVLEPLLEEATSIDTPVKPKKKPKQSWKD